MRRGPPTHHSLTGSMSAAPRVLAVLGLPGPVVLRCPLLSHRVPTNFAFWRTTVLGCLRLVIRLQFSDITMLCMSLEVWQAESLGPMRFYQRLLVTPTRIFAASGGLLNAYDIDTKALLWTQPGGNGGISQIVPLANDRLLTISR